MLSRIKVLAFAVVVGIIYLLSTLVVSSSDTFNNALLLEGDSEPNQLVSINQQSSELIGMRISPTSSFRVTSASKPSSSSEPTSSSSTLSPQPNIRYTTEQVTFAEPLLAGYGLGRNDLRSQYDRFDKERMLPRNDLIDATQLEEPAYSQYYRTVLGLRDLRDFMQSSSATSLPMNVILEHVLRITRSLENRVHDLSVTSGVKARAKNKLIDIRDRLWKAMDNLQNPKDCSRRIAFFCRLNNPYGFAASVHDILACMIAGLQTNRTVILKSDKWPQIKGHHWRDFFSPLSNCATAGTIQKNDMPFEKNKPRIYVTQLPRSIGSDLLELHADPYAFFYGVVMSYILRPIESLKGVLDSTMRNITGVQPYVAVHIRRTDKNSEAQYRELSDYMKYTEEYFSRKILTENIFSKRVFVATDDPYVIQTLKKSYPTYIFLYDEKHSNDKKKRGSVDALEGIMSDIWMLSRAEHLVCTLSSGFCRLAYELMQGVHDDAWRRISSLDNDYHYAYVLPNDRIPTEPYFDRVFSEEVQGNYRTPSNYTYLEAVEYATRIGNTDYPRDGFTISNDNLRRVANFKTTQPISVIDYKVEI